MHISYLYGRLDLVLELEELLATKSHHTVTRLYLTP
jgi:hypothetical protein